jgi:hypothetical protein
MKVSLTTSRTRATKTKLMSPRPKTTLTSRTSLKRMQRRRTVSPREIGRRTARLKKMRRQAIGHRRPNKTLLPRARPTLSGQRRAVEQRNLMSRQIEEAAMMRKNRGE